MDGDSHSHQPKPWHALQPEQVLNELNTTPDGLSDAEASHRITAYGRNELRSKPAKSLLAMLKEQIVDPMILILIGAAACSAFLREWTEAGVIFAIVVINALIGIIQEKKAQSSLAALAQMSAPHARVLREGEEDVVPAAELVPGDIVLLADGDMVPADLRLVESANLSVQEASLTGESVPIDKDADAICAADCPLGDRLTMVYSSSIVTYGRGAGIVVATGMRTEVGAIAGMLDDQPDDLDTPLKRKLSSIGLTLTVVGVIVCVLIFAIGMLYGRPLVPLFLVAISLAISIIPEGLPATATIVMALGVQRMAKRNALVKNLPAVETLGGATVICSDKTGTLTLNRMTVTEVALAEDLESGVARSMDETRAAWSAMLPGAAEAQSGAGGVRSAASAEAPMHLMRAAALCNDASFDPDDPETIIGDPTEGALIMMARDLGLDHEAIEDRHPREFEQPFDSERKRMTTVHRIGGRVVAYVKGATEEMLGECTHILGADGPRPLTERDRGRIAAMQRSMSGRALRVLGFAMRELDSVPDDDAANVERDLTFIGMIGMIDPPRTEVAESVRVCREAGIRTVMITGDHRITAATIARELGILREGDTVISGDELDRMGEAELDEAVRTAAVFARVSPADKLRIIESLKRNGEIAAMTGDGVNDSPALKAADIGVAMGVTGTDVAKDAADMILLDDSFTTIAYAIKEGRRVRRNIQKVIQFLLVGNIAEVTTLFAAIALNVDAPLLAVHILWVNLATATLPALALGVDPASRNIMRHQPERTDTLFDRAMIRRVAVQGLFVAALTTAAYWIGDMALCGGSMHGQTVGRTMAFCVLAFAQLLRSFNQRSNTEPIWVRAEGVNPWLIASVLASAALMAVILFVPALHPVFKVTVLGGAEWLVVLGLSALSVIGVELAKAAGKLRAKRR